MNDPQAPPVDAPPVDVTEANEPAATTAGEESHAKVERFRGEDADAPADTGKPPQED